MLDTRSTYRAIEAAGLQMAIIPVGSIEEHGPHLPLAVDSMLAEALAVAIARRLPALVLPPVAYGNSRALRGFAGTVWLSHDTLGRVIREISECLLDQGFGKIVVLNVHSGNVGLRTAVRDLNALGTDGWVFLVSPLDVARRELGSVIESVNDERHAGELETSLILHLAPELVDGTAVDCVPVAPADYFDLSPIKNVAPEGIWGRPSLATAKKGRLAFGLMVEGSVAHIQAEFEFFESLRRPAQALRRQPPSRNASWSRR